MDEQTLHVYLLEEALNFIESQPDKAADKIYFNINRAWGTQCRDFQEVGRNELMGVQDTV